MGMKNELQRPAYRNNGRAGSARKYVKKESNRLFRRHERRAIERGLYEACPTKLREVLDAPWTLL